MAAVSGAGGGGDRGREDAVSVDVRRVWRVQLCTWAMSVLGTAALTSAGCGGTETTVTTTTPDTAASDSSETSAGADVGPPKTAFPAGFLWGAAIAGFQVDMGCPTLPASVCDDTKSDWYQWVTDPDLVADGITYNSGDPMSDGPGFWETWPTWLDTSRDVLHINALRTSIEWSRLFPDGKAEAANTVAELKALANPEAVAKYHAIFAGARARGITLMVTLNHYTLPLWLHDGKDCHVAGIGEADGCKNRGWVGKDRILRAIALYAGYCAAEFGGEVDLWGTLNEPFAVVASGYLLPSAERTNPPGVALQVEAAVSVAFNMMEAHARMYDAVHANDTVDIDQDGKPCAVGIVTNLAKIVPQNPNLPADVTAAAHAEWVYNQEFLDATILGQLDRNLDGIPEEQRADMVGRMDFIGINYYTRLAVHYAPIPGADAFKFLDFQPDTSGAPMTNVWPEGLRDEAVWAKRYKLPLYITENGTSEPKAGATAGFIQPHLAALHEAMAQGADVRGYFYWSLMDNYEWNHGLHELKFGLFGVGPGAKLPVATEAATGYGEIVKRGGF